MNRPVFVFRDSECRWQGLPSVLLRPLISFCLFSLLLEVIRQPRIIQTEQMSAEISRGDYVKLTCLTLANGKPNITIDFSATAGRRPDAKSSSTPSRLGYLGVLQTGSPEDVQMAGWRPLVESYRLKTYQPPVESRKPMLHKLVVDIRGE